MQLHVVCLIRQEDYQAQFVGGCAAPDCLTFEGFAMFSFFLICVESFPNIHLRSPSSLASTCTLFRVNIMDVKVLSGICASISVHCQTLIFTVAQPFIDINKNQ